MRPLRAPAIARETAINGGAQGAEARAGWKEEAGSADHEAEAIGVGGGEIKKEIGRDPVNETERATAKSIKGAGEGPEGAVEAIRARVEEAVTAKARRGKVEQRAAEDRVYEGEGKWGQGEASVKGARATKT